YEKVVPLWPLAGWVTSLSMITSYAVFSYMFSSSIAIILALLTRVLITGALHEDGLADFCDGFGGGTSKDRTLEIMKDSHIGTYGVLGLIFYFIVIYNLLNIITISFSTYNVVSLSQETFYSHCEIIKVMAVTFFSADVMSKAVSSTIINALPYARKESEAKNRLIYATTPTSDKIATLCLSLLPCYIIIYLFTPQLTIPFCFALMITMLTRVILVQVMKKKIQGYTGDCCGAMFLLCELTFYASFYVFINVLSHFVMTPSI
nr:adenosylcobinamide-GDP ribazoletransferase [Bacteroidaceae bacterium]